MSHFAYYNPGGVWALETVIPHGFLQQIDQNLFKCINGDDGGTFSPSSPIVIGGQGINVTTDMISSGYTRLGTASGDSLDVYATVGFNSPIDVFSGSFGVHFGVTSSLLGDVILGSNATNTLTVNADATFAHTSSFTGNAAFASGISVALGATFSSTASFVGAITATGGISATGASAFQVLTANGILNVAGGASVTTAMACSGAGRVARPAVIGAASGGGTASPVTANEYYFSSVTADETYTIDDTNAIDGDWIEFWTNSATNSVTVNDPSAVALQTIKNAPGNYVWMKVKLIAGTWRLVGLTKA